MTKKTRKPKQKTYCPGCQLPRAGYTERICQSCAHHAQSFPQAHVQIMDGRTLNLGGKVSRRPGCE